MEFYTAKNDRCFKALYMQENNKDILKDLLEEVLKIKISSIKLMINEQTKENVNLKYNNLDCIITSDNKRIGIEMNSTNTEFYRVKSACYIFDDYSHHFQKNQDYDDITKFIQINFTYQNSCSKDIYKEYYLQNDNQERFIENFLIIEYNMDEVEKRYKKNDIKFINNNKLIISLNRNLQELTSLSESDERVKRFMKKIEKVNEDPEFRVYMTEEEKRITEENTIKSIATRKGFEKGTKENQINTAKAMLKEKLDINLISKCTNLSVEEIEKIKNSL